MYHHITEVLPIKQSWAKAEPHEAAQELSKILQQSIDKFSKNPPFSVQDENKKWKLISHCLTPIEKHLVLSLVFLEE